MTHDIEAVAKWHEAQAQDARTYGESKHHTIFAAIIRAAMEAPHNADGESYRDMWLASMANVARVAAKANKYREALQEIVASGSPLGCNGVPSHKEIARRALAQVQP